MTHAVEHAFFFTLFTLDLVAYPLPGLVSGSRAVRRLVSQTSHLPIRGRLPYLRVCLGFFHWECAQPNTLDNHAFLMSASDPLPGPFAPLVSALFLPLLFRVVVCCTCCVVHMFVCCVREAQPSARAVRAASLHRSKGIFGHHC